LKDNESQRAHDLGLAQLANEESGRQHDERQLTTKSVMQAAQHAENESERQNSFDGTEVKHRHDETMARVRETAVVITQTAGQSHALHSAALKSDDELRELVGAFCAKLGDEDSKGLDANKLAKEFFNNEGFEILVRQVKAERTTAGDILLRALKRWSGGKKGKDAEGQQGSTGTPGPC
jgi:hypothetical protein